MPENMSIAYRGANYAIGQGPQFYGIWHATAPQGAPLEWWPLTPEGWTGAWSRFASIEVPGTIAPASMNPPPGASPPPAAAQPPSTAQAPMTAQAPTAAQAPTQTWASAGTAAAASQTSPATATPAPSAATETPTSQTSPVTGTPSPSDAAEATAAVAGNPSGGYAEEAIDPQYGRVVARPVSAANPARGVRNSRIAAALLALGVLLGLIGLFPDYFTGTPSLAAQPPELVPHVIYLAAWAGGAVLVLYGGVRRQVGALIAAGVSVVTFGLFFADLGTPISYGANLMGAGLILSLIGWLACAAGSVLAFAASGLSLRGWRAGTQRARLAGHEIVPTVVMILAAIGAAVAFAPSWDSYLLQTGLGTSATTTAGNAFSNPGAIIFGDVAVMVLLVAALVAAALWRPIRLGAALAVGAIIPMVAQGISGLVQVSEPTSPQQLGYTQAQASELGLRITNGLTPMFWVYCAFLGTLILLCVWMLLSQESAPGRAPSYPGFGYPGQPYPGQQYQAQPYQGQQYQAQPYPNSMAVPSDAAPPDPGGPSVPPHTAPQQ